MYDETLRRFIEGADIDTEVLNSSVSIFVAYDLGHDRD